MLIGTFIAEHGAVMVSGMLRSISACWDQLQSYSVIFTVAWNATSGISPEALALAAALPSTHDILLMFHLLHCRVIYSLHSDLSPDALQVHAPH